MFAFKSRKESLLGLDISSTAVKLVELSKQGQHRDSQCRVESYAVAPLPEGSTIENNIAEAEPVGETIKRVIKASGTRNRRCALALPSSLVINKMITMPAAIPDDEMESQVMLEAEQYIPYSMDEVNFDFEVLGPSRHASEMVDVLLAATRSENVEIRVAAAQMAGLHVDIMDIESYAIEHVFNFSRTDLMGDVVAVVDIGATMSAIHVFEEGRMVFSREQGFGGKQLTEEIMQRYGLNYEEAGIAKKEGNLPENYLPEVLEPFKETMAQQVHRFLQFYYASSQRNSIDRLLLGGGCAGIPGIDEIIESRASVATAIVNPFTRMQLGNRVNPRRFSSDTPALMIAAGLAVRSFH